MNETYATLIGIGIQTLLYLLGGYSMVVRNDARTDILREQIEGMTKELKKLADVVTLQAVQTERIQNLSARVTMLQRNIEDLRRGDGYIRPHIEGEDH